MFVTLLLGLFPLTRSSEPPTQLVEIRRFDPVADQMYEEVTFPGEVRTDQEFRCSAGDLSMTPILSPPASPPAMITSLVEDFS